MSAISLEIIEERLAELESRVLGADEQPNHASSSVESRLSELAKKVALYTAGRRNINRIFSQLQQLENSLQMSMKPGGALPTGDLAALRTMCEVILMEYDHITEAVENLKKVAQLQNIFNSKPISNTLDYVDRLNRITAKQQEQTAKLDDLMAKTNAIVVAYNKMIAELGDWASVWCEND